MLKPLHVLAVGVTLLAQPVLAAQYNCAKKEMGVKLNDYDIAIKQREEVVAEIKGEIKDTGGSTEQQKQALQSLEEKLAKAKADREALLAECDAKPAL